MPFNFLLKLIIVTIIFSFLDCSSDNINSNSIQIKFDGYDTFVRLYPKDHRIFYTYDDENGSLKVEHKPIDSVFYCKQDSQAVKIIKTGKYFMSVGIVNSYSIYGVDLDSVYIYNLKTNKSKSFWLGNDFVVEGESYMHFVVPELKKLALSNDRKKLYLPTTNIGYTWWKSDYFSDNILITEFNLETGQKRLLDYIKYPKELTKKFYAEDVKYFYTVNNKDELVISFQPLKNLYVYDLRKEKFDREIDISDCIPKKPPYDTAHLEDLSFTLAYHYNTPSYYYISYEPKNQLYFRMCLTPTKNKKRKEFGQSYFSKYDLHLLVYNNNFEEIWQHNFGDSVNFFNYYLTKNKFSIRSYINSKTYEYFENYSINKL